MLRLNAPFLNAPLFKGFFNKCPLRIVALSKGAFIRDTLTNTCKTTTLHYFSFVVSFCIKIWKFATDIVDSHLM